MIPLSGATEVTRGLCTPYSYIAVDIIIANYSLSNNFKVLKIQILLVPFLLLQKLLNFFYSMMKQE